MYVDKQAAGYIRGGTDFELQRVWSRDGCGRGYLCGSETDRVLGGRGLTSMLGVGVSAGVVVVVGKGEGVDLGIGILVGRVRGCGCGCWLGCWVSCAGWAFVYQVVCCSSLTQPDHGEQVHVYFFYNFLECIVFPKRCTCTFTHMMRWSFFASDDVIITST